MPFHPSFVGTHCRCAHFEIVILRVKIRGVNEKAFTSLQCADCPQQPIASREAEEKERDEKEGERV